ncbi:CoA-binding protein [Paenibacillus sp. P26]|nr:CoA-binding protein [Paenibacillus sp. P26]
MRQLPELRSGCEVTSLAMLLQYYHVDKSKLELAGEMKMDPTPIRWNSDGSIASWGNPNLGFVGDVTGASKGFGIYHTALYELLKKYAPSAVDLTGKPFDGLEKKLRSGIPSVVWTTIDYNVPDKWVVWDTPIGPIQTTFMEHAVLLVGYDGEFVYVNDPLTGRGKQKIEKERFVASWEAMGRQALSLTVPRTNHDEEWNVMAFENPSRERIKEILKAAGTVAVVGLSDKPDRVSHMVAEAMQKKGYRIIPVNPTVEGTILGETCYASLSDIPEPVDIVNVFRRSEQTVPVAEEAVKIKAKVLWPQLGIYNEEAASIAEAGGLEVIMDRCIKVEDSILLPGGK